MAGFGNYYDKHWTSFIGGIGYIVLGLMLYIYWNLPNNNNTGNVFKQIMGFIGGIGCFSLGVVWFVGGIVQNSGEKDSQPPEWVVAPEQR